MSILSLLITNISTLFQSFHPLSQTLNNFFNAILYKLEYSHSFPIYVIFTLITISILKVLVDLTTRTMSKRLGLDQSKCHHYRETVWKMMFRSFTTFHIVWSAIYIPKIWDPVFISTVSYGNHGLEWIHIVQIAYYIHLIFITIFVEPRRDDIFLMLTHHFMTLYLMMVAVGAGYTNFGLLVLLLHDIDDLLLEVAKSCLYLKESTVLAFMPWNLMRNVAASLLIFFWGYTRLYLYSKYVLYTLYFSAFGEVEPLHQKDFFFSLLVCLTLLFTFNVYWMHMILDNAYKAIKGKKHGGGKENVNPKQTKVRSPKKQQ